MLKFKAINIAFIVALLAMIIYDRSVELSVWAYVLLILIYFSIQAYGSAVLSAQFFLPVRFKGDGQSGNIAITFDDGPVRGKTDAILDILKSYQVPAAFFCIGNRVTDSPSLTKNIHEAGHLIGNHSYWHKATFDLQTPAAMRKELLDTDEAILKAIGVKPKFFRPPYGVTNPMLAKAVKIGGYTTIGWSVRSFDTVINDDVVLFNRITKSLKGGDVILLHDYSNTTLTILPKLLDHVTRIGLKIVRVDVLLNEKAYA